MMDCEGEIGKREKEQNEPSSRIETSEIGERELIEWEELTVEEKRKLKSVWWRREKEKRSSS